MINYVQKKSINSALVINLLSNSVEKNLFTNGGPVKYLLEDHIAKLINLPNSKRILVVNNGTSALHALMFFYDKLHGRKLKWVTPSFTFPSCIVNQSNTIITDIDPATYTLSNDENIEDADGIIITNLFGAVLDFDYEKFKDKIIITDNASSFMSIKDGIQMCLLGNASFSSLHHTKTLGFGEGGFIVCDAIHYDELQSILGFGFSALDKTCNPLSSNFKMSDIAASYILQHMNNYDIKRHLYIQERFKYYIDQIDGAELLGWHDGIFYGNLPVIFNIPADIDFFRNKGIEANKYYKPILVTPYAMDLYTRIINFPLHSDLTNDEIDIMCSAVKEFINDSRN